MIYRCPVCKRVGVIVKADNWLTRRCYYCGYQQTYKKVEVKDDGKN